MDTEPSTLSSNSTNSTPLNSIISNNLIILLKSYSNFPNCLNSEFLKSCIPIIKELKTKEENKTITEIEKQLLETFVEFFEKDTLQEQNKIAAIAKYKQQLELLQSL